MYQGRFWFDSGLGFWYGVLELLPPGVCETLEKIGVTSVLQEYDFEMFLALYDLFLQ